jgi:nitrogen fixation NifU-like protein
MNSENRPGTVDELSRLYRETILHHAAHPTGYIKNNQPQEIQATHHFELFNPLCGDRVVVLLEIEGNDIRRAAFDGESCAICTASASLLCGHAPGKSTTDLQETLAWLREAMKSDADAGGHETLLPLLGVQRYPSRIRCATLPWEAAVEAMSAGSNAE